LAGTFKDIFHSLQGVPDTMLQEEVRKLHIAVSDERKVTEKLSRNLELEKRRSESLEQKAKSAFRRSGASSGTAVFLPEELRFRDEQVKESMEKYRDQLERVTRSLQECEEKLTGFEIQVHLLVAFRAIAGDDHNFFRRSTMLPI
jgi:hypothetical protein